MPPKSQWTTEEQFELVCKVLFQDDKMPSYSGITIGDRTHKAIGNTLRDLKAKYGSPGNNSTDGEPASKAGSNKANATAKKATAGKKRGASAPASDVTKKRAKKQQQQQPESSDENGNEQEV